VVGHRICDDVDCARLGQASVGAPHLVDDAGFGPPGRSRSGPATASYRRGAAIAYVQRGDLRPWRLPCAAIENRIMTQRELEDLPPDECFQLLAAAHVGRLVYQDDLGPLAVPVNYAMAGHDIVFRVEGGAKRAAMQQPVIAFEVDHVDEEQKFGWSVLVRGAGAEVDMERVPALLRAMDGHGPTPWAAGIHKVWLQIVPHTVTGRRLGAEKVSW